MLASSFTPRYNYQISFNGYESKCVDQYETFLLVYFLQLVRPHDRSSELFLCFIINPTYECCFLLIYIGMYMIDSGRNN